MKALLKALVKPLLNRELQLVLQQRFGKGLNSSAKCLDSHEEDTLTRDNRDRPLDRVGH